MGEETVRLIGALGTIFAATWAGAAFAQTWDLTTHLAPGSPSSCPKVNATFGVTLSGSALSVRIPAGQTHRGTVAPDGTVEVQYDSTARAVGRITIKGNAQTRTFALTASPKPECVYALVESVPTEPASAYPGSIGEWALGRWNGLQVRNVQGVGLQSSPYSLIVEKQRSGKVFCRFGEPEVVIIVLWASQCSITANAASITSGESQLNLQRIAEGRLEGTMRYPGGSATIRLAR